MPALEGTTSSDVLAKHLNALHCSRKAFIKCEADEKIRRALRYNIRAVEEVFHPGDRVFYKKDGNMRWFGPAKVVFQDGRIVFVRHGGVYVRVSVNRLQKNTESDVDNVDEEKLTENEQYERLQGNDASHLKHHADEDVENICGNEELQELEVAIDDTVEQNEVNNDESFIDNAVRTNEKLSIHDVSSNKMIIQNEEIRLKRNDMIKYRLDESDKWEYATVLGRAGKATGKISITIIYVIQVLKCKNVLI